MLKCEDPTDTSEKVQSEFKKKKRGGGLRRMVHFDLEGSRAQIV